MNTLVGIRGTILAIWVPIYHCESVLAAMLQLLLTRRSEQKSWIFGPLPFPGLRLNCSQETKLPIFPGSIFPQGENEILWSESLRKGEFDNTVGFFKYDFTKKVIV